MRAAAPNYLGSNFSEAPPGHRFGLYYAGYDDGFKPTKTEKTQALKSLCAFPHHSQALLTALLARQQTNAEAQADTVLTLPYVASSPFATGLGNEHPLENGFSFLTPYGLPYLPGSGIKGVIRRAAEELASGDWGDTNEWNEAAIRVLFGPGEEDFKHDRDTPPLQGALRFWDAFPRTPKDAMSVEIMTPHLGDFYQGKATPNTRLAPIPIPFLAMPPKTTFCFHVECHLGRIADASLRNEWKSLVETAFVHAGQWLGFGAKTAVGYGRMALDSSVNAARQEQQKKATAEALKAKQAEQREAALASLSPLDRAIAEIIEARPQSQPELNALYSAFKKGQWHGDDAVGVAKRLQAEMKTANLWREKSEKKKPEKDKPYQMTLAVLAALRTS